MSPAASPSLWLVGERERWRQCAVGALDELVNYLRGKEVLLILDSVEHLLDGMALLVDLLQQAHEVKLLVINFA